MVEESYCLIDCLLQCGLFHIASISSASPVLRKWKLDVEGSGILWGKSLTQTNKSHPTKQLSKNIYCYYL